MNTSEWKELKSELESRNFKVSIKGRSRSEMIAESDHLIIDIYKKGISNSGTRPEIYIYDIENMVIIEHFNEYFVPRILDRVDAFIADYE